MTTFNKNNEVVKPVKKTRKSFVAALIILVGSLVYLGVFSASEKLVEAYSGNQTTITVVPHIEKSK